MLYGILAQEEVYIYIYENNQEKEFNWIVSDCASSVCIHISTFKHVSPPRNMKGLRNSTFLVLDNLMKNIHGTF